MSTIILKSNKAPFLEENVDTICIYSRGPVNAIEIS